MQTKNTPVYTDLSVSCRWLPVSRCIGRPSEAQARRWACVLTTTWRPDMTSHAPVNTTSQSNPIRHTSHVAVGLLVVTCNSRYHFIVTWSHAAQAWDVSLISDERTITKFGENVPQETPHAGNFNLHSLKVKGQGHEVNTPYKANALQKLLNEKNITDFVKTS